MAETFAGGEEVLPQWAGDPGEWEETPQDAEGEEPQGPSPEVLEQANALFSEKEAAIRASLGKYGLDLATDGTPVIRDPSRFEQWTEPLVKAKAEPPPPVPEPQPKQELWEMDEEKLGELVEKRAQKLLQPLLEKFQAQEAILGKRWQDDAVRQAPQALAEFAPEMAYIAQHPEFEEKFRMAISKLSPEYLENTQALAATALQTVAFMDKAKMPKKEMVGSRADAARAQVARQTPGVQSWGQEYAAPPDREQHDAMDNLRTRFMRQFVDSNFDPAELRALEAVDEKGFNTITAYQAALAKAKRGRK